MFTNQQTEQQDRVDNAIYDMICNVVPGGVEKIEWDIELIGTIRDAISTYLVDKDVCTEQEFYPYKKI